MAINNKHHFIFYLAESVEKPVIIGVIHEKRDMVKRLAERLTCISSG